jgi:hypothetical protein
MWLVRTTDRADTTGECRDATHTGLLRVGFGKYIRLEEMGTIGGATGADPREK